MKKRILSILLSIVMLMSVIPLGAIPAFAENDDTVPQAIPAALQNTSWKGEMKVSDSENVPFILQIGTDSACFTYNNETIILPFLFLGEDNTGGLGTFLGFKNGFDDGFSLVVSFKDDAVIGIMAQFDTDYLNSIGDITKIITLRDIIGTISGTYTYTATMEQVIDDISVTITGTFTMTLSEDMVIMETCKEYGGYEVLGEAEKVVLDHAGTRAYRTEEFAGGKPVYGDPYINEISSTALDEFWDSSIVTTEAETEVEVIDGTIIVPAEAYYDSGRGFYFYDIQNDETQKLCIDVMGDKDGKGVVLYRVSEEERLTLRDILGKVGGTYSVSAPEEFATVTINENEFCLEMVDLLNSMAEKIICNSDGTTIWGTENFENGKPVYGTEPGVEDKNTTIGVLLNTEITISEKEHDITGAPAGSYVLDFGLMVFSFYDEDEESGETQKLNFNTVELYRVPEHEHEFSDAEYTWSGADCTATAACTGCSETVTGTKTGEFKQDTAATCTEAAKGHYEVTFDSAVLGSAATNKNSVTFGDPNGHTWTEARENKAGKSSLKAAATCTADAVYYKVCSVCDAVSEDLTWTDEGTAGHKFTGKAVSNGDGTHSFKCTGCTAVGTMNGNTAVENGKVSCSGGAATCQSGAVCSACNAVYTEKNPANHVGTANLVKGAVKATCARGGYTGDTYWSCCQNELYKKGTATGTNANNHTDQNGDGICDDCGNCSKCGGTHPNNFWGQIVCFFNRMINWFKNLFK